MSKSLVSGMAIMLMAYAPALAQDKMSAEERQRFVAVQQQDCVETQKKIPGNAKLADELLVLFCACMADELADRLTRAEAFSDPGAVLDLKTRTDAAFGICLPKMRAAAKR